MSQALTIGVDFGSTGLRVAWLGEGGQPVVLPDGLGNPWPWIFCERHSGARLGIAFPSLKSKLGTNGATPLDGLRLTPAEVVIQLFRAVKRSVEDHTSRAVSEAVVTVPALYSASQRTALREAVLAAGFAEVHLLNDSVAAVIAQAMQREGPATVLVYAMGYSGFELGLIRAAHGHYRALGYEGGWAPAGWAFDQLLLESLLGFLEEQHLRPGINGWDAARWLQVRAVTEQVKEGLSTEERVAFPISLETPEGRPLGYLSLGRAGFEEAIRPWFDRTFQQTSSLLELAGMSLAQVDTVLLVGGSTRIPVLHPLVTGALGHEPVSLDREALVRGAALFAAQLGSRPVPAVAEQERAAERDAAKEIPADLTALRAALAVAAGPLPQAAGERLVLVAGDGAATPALPGPAGLLQPAIRMMEAGRTAEARSLLEELIREAQSLLVRLDQPTPSPASPPSPTAILARRALARAQQLLKKGQYEEAVRESHLAWQQDRDNPDTFEEMIGIHCQAAQASSYADALRWLGCAYNHDEGNIRVRHLVAERHFQHARQLAGQGKRTQASDILDLCFSWNPEHAGARELQASLTRR